MSNTTLNDLGDLVSTLINDIETGLVGPQGQQGVGISSIIRTSGTGAPGTTDTYTITYTDATTSTFQVYNGADGVGSGDMLKSENLSGLANYATARTNLGLDTTANQTDSIDKRFMSDVQESKLDAITGTNTGDETKASIESKLTGTITSHNHSGVYQPLATVLTNTTASYTTAIDTRLANTSGTNTGDQTNITGNAGTATALQTARTIGGVSFNGTANINLPGVNITGNQNTTGTASNVTGIVAIANGGTGSATQNFVDLTTNQTVGGVKTFSSFPVTPSSAPTTDYQVANKKYVDDNSGGGTTLKSVVFTTRTFDQAGSTQIITHGAGVIPKYAIFKTQAGRGYGSYNGINNYAISGGSETSGQTSNTKCINISNSSAVIQLTAAASNFTSTQMTLTWDTGTGNGATESIMIEFYG